MGKTSIIFLSFIFALTLNANTITEENSLLIEQAIQDDSIAVETIEEVQEVDKVAIFKEESQKEIKKLLKKKRTPSKLSKKQTVLYYKKHDYTPFFIDETGVKPLATNLLDVIEEDQVLKPYTQKLFKLSDIKESIDLIEAQEAKSIKELVELDFTLVGVYHRYMNYLAKGFINWKAFQKKLAKLNEDKEIIANWKKYSVRKNYRKLLYKAFEENDIQIAINEVNYKFPRANQLAELIQDYEKIALDGGYTKIPKIKKSLRKGNYYPQIKQLRQRLYESKDLDSLACYKIESQELQASNEITETVIEASNISTQTTKVSNNQIIEKTKDIKDCMEFFDDTLFEAVKAFQHRHGLVEDGIVGRATIARLNIPVEKKIKKIRINLERMRWMPRTLGNKYLIVNIPDYKLKMYDEGELKLDMAVVVGEYKNPTPIFSHRMSSIVLNPYWRIPQRIVKREIIPKLAENPDYLKGKGVKVFENWSHKSMEFDMDSIDWTMYVDNDLIGNTQSAPMRFIQMPSNHNPLGRMKFMFPNRYSVYLHDTPAKKFFKYRKRAFSHGCIRLAQPHKLLETIAQKDVNVDYTEAKKILKDIEKTDFDLTKKIPVHLIYLTAWIGEDGKVHFRDDVYRYDRMHGDILYKSL